MVTLHLRLEQFISSFKIFGVAIWAQVMLNVLDALLRLLLQKSLIKSMDFMVMDDRGVKVREIASAMGISNERVHNILHQHLDMTKLSARWVPRLTKNEIV
uniref:Uncharacterized protein n=1 Tax=Rhodnius prolixus TaxID=13249 RepID=T1IFR7_RHOPR